MKVLEIKKLTKRFDGVFAVNDLSLEIEKGSVVGIIGPNGSGKTTLVNLLSGIVPIDKGKVTVNNSKNFTKIKPCQIYSHGITRTFQHVRLFEQMSVLDNILVVLTERNIFGSLFVKYGDHCHKYSKKILERVNLWDKKDKLVCNLSYGQRKLLEIARALATKSKIYFFDEPFAGIFPEMRKIVASIIKELKLEKKTIILIEHDMVLIRELCDYLFVLDEGKLLAHGKPDVVLKRKNVVKAYLGE